MSSIKARGGTTSRRRRSQARKRVRVLIVSERILLQLGVRGLVLKGSPFEELVRCIRWVVGGGTSIRQNHISPESTPSTFRAVFDLTHREMQMIEAVIAGRTNKQIARRFRLSVDTVKHHLTNIFNKTGASNRLELVLFAIDKNVVDTS